MTEMYVAVRDAIRSANVEAGVWKAPGGSVPVPGYARGEDAPSRPVRTGDDLFDLHPHLVRERVH